MERVISLVIALLVGIVIGMIVSELLNAKLQQEYERALTYTERQVEELQVYIEIQKQAIFNNMRK